MAITTLVYDWKWLSTKTFPPPLTDDASLGRMPEPEALAGIPLFSLANPESGIDGTDSGHPSLPIPVTTPQPAENTSSPSLALPPKLLRKILSLEFVEMSELLPELWGRDSEATPQCCHQVRPQLRRGPITNILLWLDCYSTLVAALATRFPQYVGDFMAYQRTIIRASKNFEGAAWVMYDRCFRRRAAATKSLNWGKIDSALYNESFTGRARSIPRCHLCLSDNHLEAYCPDRVIASQSGAQGFTSWAPQSGPFPRSESSARAPLSEICQLFNRVRCKSTRCKRRHICNQCKLPHPEIVCPDRPERRGRSRSPHQQRARAL